MLATAFALLDSRAAPTVPHGTWTWDVYVALVVFFAVAVFIGVGQSRQLVRNLRTVPAVVILVALVMAVASLGAMLALQQLLLAVGASGP